MIKDRVLSILLDAKKEYVSGEAMAEKLGVSRMAVNKAVAQLRDEGIDIMAVPKKGYFLGSDDVFNGVSVLRYLDPDVKLFFYDSVEGSTNDVAKRIELDYKKPFVVVTDHQTGGRGRLGRRFESPSGGLYFSLCLPKGYLTKAGLITTAAAVAVAETLKDVSGLEFSIKWVNDVYLAGKKCTGILTEGVVDLELGGLEAAIIGIGINVNTKEDELISLYGKATGLFIETGKVFCRAEILGLAVSKVMAVLKEDFLSRYRRLCFLIGHGIERRAKDGTAKEGIVSGIDDEGYLVVSYPDGCDEHFSSAEVTISLNDGEQNYILNTF